MGSFGGFNFVYGDYRNYTKSAGTTSDIERLYFTGFHQHFFWNDANTCKQYIGIRDNFDYNGKDANVSRTSDFFYCNGIIRLNCPTSSTQSISSITAGTLRVNANNNNCVYNIINSSCPNFSFNGSATGCSINITNHSFIENTANWSSNLTGAGTSATITNMFGLRLYPPSNQIGLTITNNWGVYSGWSSARNYFAGNVGIGTTSISNALDVNGNATISTSLQVPQITNTGNITIDPSNILFINGDTYVGTASINSSAVLQADSTIKGFLPPRMTATQANTIVSPAEGLIVYVTDTGGSPFNFTSKGWWGYDGTTWKQLG